MLFPIRRGQGDIIITIFITTIIMTLSRRSTHRAGVQALRSLGFEREGEFYVVPQHRVQEEVKQRATRLLQRLELNRWCVAACAADANGKGGGQNEKANAFEVGFAGGPAEAGVSELLPPKEKSHPRPAGSHQDPRATHKQAVASDLGEGYMPSSLSQATLRHLAA